MARRCLRRCRECGYEEVTSCSVHWVRKDNAQKLPSLENAEDTAEPCVLCVIDNVYMPHLIPCFYDDERPSRQ